MMGGNNAKTAAGDEREKQVITSDDVKSVSAEELLGEPAKEQAPDQPGEDTNADGLKGGQSTADNHGDVLGV